MYYNFNLISLLKEHPFAGCKNKILVYKGYLIRFSTYRGIS